MDVILSAVVVGAFIVLISAGLTLFATLGVLQGFPRLDLALPEPTAGPPIPLAEQLDTEEEPDGVGPPPPPLIDPVERLNMRPGHALSQWDIDNQAADAFEAKRRQLASRGRLLGGDIPDWVEE